SSDLARGGAVIVLAVALAGGVGATLRFIVDGAVARWRDQPVPLGMLVVNLTGSFLLGLLVALARDRAGLDALVTVLGTGMLGGYTSFSTASLEAVTIALRAGVRAAGGGCGAAGGMRLVGLDGVRLGAGRGWM